jgi:muramidase (phage lysozyme)
VAVRIGITLSLLMLLCAVPAVVRAEAFSLLREDTLFGERRALLPRAQTETPRPSGSSLFVGVEGKSMFAPFPERAPVAREVLYSGKSGTQVERLRSLIAKAEAGRMGYDAVQYGATVRPSKRPTNMTIAEIYKWIKDTPGQPHAIGRYQFIPPTLRSLVKRLGVSHDTVFSPRIQDQLGDILLVEAGLMEMNKGKMSRHTFMNNLAKIWAGLPNSSGKSHYHGYAGNKATMTWASFDRQMQSIFPG